MLVRKPHKMESLRTPTPTPQSECYLFSNSRKAFLFTSLARADLGAWHQFSTSIQDVRHQNDKKETLVPYNPARCLPQLGLFIRCLDRDGPIWVPFAQRLFLFSWVNGTCTSRSFESQYYLDVHVTTDEAKRP